MLLLDFHRIFLKTSKKVNITKFQKVEFFSFCDSVIHIHIIFEIIFHYKLLQNIDFSSLYYTVTFVACCIPIFLKLEI